MRDMFKRIVSFALVAMMTLSLCSPGIVTSYATQDTDTTEPKTASTGSEADNDSGIVVDESDFASKRLVIIAEDASVITDDDKVIGQYGNIYLLQYDSVEEAENAYTWFKDKVKAVEPDKDVTVAASTHREEVTSEVGETAESKEDADIVDESNAIAVLSDMDMSAPVQKKGVIALIDTGVSKSDNVIDRVSVIDDALTGNGHGDIMLADIVSQNPDAAILSIRAMDDDGLGTISSLVAAMEYAIDQKVDYINLSLYARTTLTTSVLEQEIIKATEKGIIVTGAAGNDGVDVKDYVPGSVMEAYIIGAAKEDGSRLGSSNFGETVDYNVVADSTSEAAALFTGYISANGLDSVDNVLNQGMIYATNYKTTNDGTKDDNVLGKEVQVEFDIMNEGGTVTLGDTEITDDTKVLTLHAGEAPIMKIVSDDSHYMAFASVYSKETNKALNGVYGLSMAEEHNWTFDVPDEDVVVKISFAELTEEEIQERQAQKANQTADTTEELFQVAIANGDKLKVTKYDEKYNTTGFDVNLRVGYFEVTGGITAFCCEHTNQPPSVGTEGKVDEVITKNSTERARKLRKALWYGWGGPKDIGPSPSTSDVYQDEGLTTDASHFRRTTLAVSYANGHSDNAGSYGEKFLAYLDKKYDDVPNDNGFVVYHLSTPDSGDQDLIFWQYNPTGTATVKKVSAYTGLTKDNSNYSLEGAVYEIYTDQKCTKKATYSGTMKTASNGTSNAIKLSPGTYYIKEKTASKGYQLDATVHKVVVKAGENTTFTSKEIPLVSVKVTKSWDDQSDKYKIRPTSITAYLYSGTSESNLTKTSTSVTLNADNKWTQTVSKLPQSDASGNRIYYSFKEAKVPTNYKETVSSVKQNSSKTGYEVTIKNTVKTGKLYMQKESADKTLTNNNSKYSLAGAEYTVYGKNNNGTLSDSKGKLTTDANGKTGELELLPGTYYIKETKASTGFTLDPTIYTVEVTDGKTVTANTTSKEPPLISMKVTKKWDDQDDKFKVRPSSITLDLYSGSSESSMTTKVGKSVTLNANNNWTATITGLPQTDSSNNRIYYTFKESSVPDHYTSTTSAVTKNTAGDGYEVTITNKLPTGYGQVKKTSTFTGLTNNNSKYPLAGAVYEIYTDKACTTKANYSGTMTTTSTGDSNAIELIPGTYYAKEKSAPSGYQLDPTVYTVVVKAGETATFTSKEIPIISVSVKKVWSDQNDKFKVRPTSITAYLYSGSSEKNLTKTTQSVVLNAGNNWTGTISNLPQTDSSGTRIYYSFKEAEVPNYYDESVSTAEVNTTKDGYAVTLTNTLTPGTATVQKTSTYTSLTNGNSNYPLAGAVYEIYTDQACTKKAIYDSTMTTTSTGASNAVELLPGTYYIKEKTPPKGYQLDETVHKVVVEKGKAATFTSKEIPLVSIKVTKAWDDQNDKYKIRPTSITAYLYSGTSESNMTKTSTSVTLNANNNWTQTINDLPQTDAKDNRIYYSFKEAEVPKNYTESVSSVKLNSNNTGYEVTITNKIQLGKGKVQKVSTYTTITSGNTNYPLTGAEYTIYTDQACKNKAIYDGTLTTTASGATNEVDLVPGTYYVKETKAPNGYKLDPKVYTLVVTADKTTTITSKDVPLISLTVKKAWDDDNDKFKIRPTSLTVYLYSGGAANSLSKTDKYVTLNANNNWTASINDLPQTDDNGNTIYYSFKEDKVPDHYEASVSDTKLNTAKTGYDVTITNTLPTGFGQVQKVSLDTTLTNGNSKYPLNGAEYTIYTDQACTKKATYESTMTTMTDGKSNAIELVPGTYYVKETKAPNGFRLDPTVYTVVVTKDKTTTFTSKEIPLVSLTVKKTWTDQDNKFGVRPTSLVVYLYSGSSEKNLAKTSQYVTLNAGNNWTQTINDLPQTDDKGNRIYYGFKEDKTPEFYNETDSAATLITAKNGYEVSITNELQIGYLKLLKTSLKPDLTNGNANYTLKDAVYTVYTDKDCKTKAKYFGELRTDEKGATGTIELLPGTYYVKETTAPKGFQLSDEVFTVTIKDKATVNIDAVDTPIYSKLSLKKVSADAGRKDGLTDNNDCYSLEGAEYYVYTDAACKTRAKDSSGNDITLITKADGTTSEAEVVANTYYIREIKASKGYYLDDCNTKTPHSITLELGKDGSVTCTEKPMNDPFAVTMSKKSYKNGVEITNNAPSLEGAIFEVDYYQNTDGKTSGTPAKKWYFKTDAKGRFVASIEEFYVSTATLDDGTIVKSDPLYRSNAGNPTYPLGTYTIREVKAPTYYEIKGTATVQGTGTTIDDPSKPLTFIIKTDPEKGTPGIYDGAKPTSGRISVTNEVGITYNEEVYEGSLKIVKYGDGDKPLAGVKFKLVGDDGSVYTGTTDKNGTYTFTELMPQHYVLTETETPDGYTLLKDNVDIDIPHEMSDQEVKDAKVDTSKAVHDASKATYYFYDVTYNIKNGQAFPVVYTGGDQTMLYAGMAAAFALMGIGGFLMIKRRKENR